MKKLLVFGIFISQAALAQSDSQIKFRDLEWGVSAKSIPGLKQVEDSSGIKCYVKSAEKLKVGDASIEKIRYCFYKDKFGYVMIDYKDQINQLIIKDVLDKKFGGPYRPNKFMDDYWWNIGGEVAIHMGYSEISGIGSVIYRYKPVSDLQTQDREASNTDAANDL